MKKIIIIIATLLSLNQFANACGTLDDWIDAYNGKGWIKDKSKKEALIGIYTCGIYHYRGQDKEILKVILNAKENIKEINYQRYYGPMDRERKYTQVNTTILLLEEIYRRYNCLQYAKNEIGYKKIVKLFGNTSCFKENLKQMRVKVTNTANIRQAPKGKKIGYVKNNTIINIISKKDDWYKINVPGDMRDIDRVDVGYIHSSLLESL